MVDQLDERIVESNEGQPMQRTSFRRLAQPDAIDCLAKPAHHRRVERVLDDQVTIALELGRHIREYEPQPRSGPAA